MAKLGVVGLGIVGDATRFCFSTLGHNVIVHDIKLSTKIEDVIDTEACYICVPTPTVKDGLSCDVSIVEDVVAQLSNLNYKGIAVIRSTVKPGTTASLQAKHPDLKICHVLETLRERFSYSDATENCDILVIGTEDQSAYEIVRSHFGHYPKKTFKMPSTESELAKLFSNSYHMMLVVFANSFYEICQSYGANYDNIKGAIQARPHVSKMYMDVSDKLRAANGVCLLKDSRSLMNICEEKAPHVELFHHLIRENSKYKQTVFEGMRMEDPR